MFTATYMGQGLELYANTISNPVMPTSKASKCFFRTMWKLLMKFIWQYRAPTEPQQVLVNYHCYKWRKNSMCLKLAIKWKPTSRQPAMFIAITLPVSLPTGHWFTEMLSSPDIKEMYTLGKYPLSIYNVWHNYITPVFFLLLFCPYLHLAQWGQTHHLTCNESTIA